MKEMVGGCCVCSDDRGWTENPLVYCDGIGCTVAVHQACYGIVTVPVGNWYCRKCESVDSEAKVKCELCPNKDGALKPTDSNAWAHVVCALYIPEVRFGNVTTMEPIVLSQIPPERYHKACYLCEEAARGSSRANVGACMQCNKAGCKAQFHVTCAQSRGLLCEEAGNYVDNVKYCGYCHHHYTKIVIKKKGVNVKVIPPYKPLAADSPDSHATFKDSEMKTSSKRKLSTPLVKSASGKPASSSSSSSSLAGSEESSNNSKTSNVVEDGVNSKPALSTSILSGSKPALVPEPSKSPAVVPPLEIKRRRKGERRTPPVTGLSSEDSSRPITPQSGAHSSSVAGMSLSGMMSSGSHHMGNVSVSNPPSNSPNLTISSCGLSGQHGVGSNASSPTGSHESKRPMLQAALKDTMRPNSIVVNVPLEVLPSSGQGNINVPPSSTPNAHTTNSLINTIGTVLPTTPLPQLDLTTSTSLLAGAPPPHSSGSPIKRSRSQSSEKTDKPRRSSKRSTGGSSSSNKSLSSSSPTNTPHIQSSIKNEVILNQQLPNASGSGISNPVNDSTSRTRRHSSSTHTSTNHISHTSTNHLSHQQPGGSASSTPSGLPPPSLNMNHIQVSPSPPLAQVKDEKTEIKTMTTVGNSPAPHMLGNTLNPSSTMAQKMCDTLSQEMVAHSVFTSDPTPSSHSVGPQLPGRNSNNTSTSTNSSNSSWGNSNAIPQSLEQLLERQWEQGSQFLMEQAQHFDIASLLTCLHQLRAENNTLEEQVTQLIQRRDHLLAVNARLAIPLVPPVTTTSTSSSNSSQNGAGVPNSIASLQQPAPIVENGLPNSSSPQDVSNFRSSTIRQNSSNMSSGSGGGNFNNPGSGQNSVLVRTSAADNRRSSHSPATSAYSNQIFQQQNQLSNQSQVVMRRDVIELNQSGSSKAS